MVRWRHSPLMPTTARMMMKRLLVSAVNTSVRTLSCVGSVSRLTRPAMSSEVPTASPANAMKVRVVRSFSTSAWSSAVMSGPP